MSYDPLVLSPRTIVPALMSSPGNPAGTTSLVGVMAGLAIAYTPQRTGRIAIIATLNGANNTVADGALSAIRTGTGAAPANGVALTGTRQGSTHQNISPVAANIFPLANSAIVTGLAVGTAIWIDLEQAAITAGTATLTNINIIVIEF